MGKYGTTSSRDAGGQKQGHKEGDKDHRQVGTHPAGGQAKDDGKGGGAKSDQDGNAEKTR